MRAEPEGDRAAGVAAVLAADAELEVLAVADGAEVAQLAARREQRRRPDCRARTARAARAPAPARASAAPGAARSRRRGVSGSSSSSVRTRVGVSRRTPRQTPRPRSGSIDRPGGGAVPAPAGEVIGARGERAVQVERARRAARALPLLLAPGDEDDRAVVTLDEPGGDDPDHAFVPVGAGNDVPATTAPILRPRLDLRDGRADDALLDGLAFAVHRLEARRRGVAPRLRRRSGAGRAPRADGRAVRPR